jgi:hypothetical protein
MRHNCATTNSGADEVLTRIVNGASVVVNKKGKPISERKRIAQIKTDSNVS